MNFFVEQRREVMQHIEKYMLEKMFDFLKPVDEIWQPSDFLPDSTKDTFFSDIKELQQNAEGISYDLLAVLIGLIVMGPGMIQLALGIPIGALDLGIQVLEIFVAFLQAYIFTFLTTLFIASAVAPEH